MRRRTALGLGMALMTRSALGNDWLGWRGPEGNNHAAPGNRLPVQWDERLNVLWRIPLPGRGHSSPVVVGNHVYLTTSDVEEQTQSLVILDRRRGEILLNTPVHRGGLPTEMHAKNTPATPTLACDGRTLYAVFNNSEAIFATALDLAGRPLWQQRIAEFKPKQYPFGYAPSPLLEDAYLIVAVEYDGPDSGIYALEASSGRPRWQRPRPDGTSYSSPIVAHIAGRRQLLISGGKKVASYNPANGQPLWSAPATTDATCGTVVWEGNMVFASGGYPDAGTYAVLADGSNRVAWSNNVQCYEQSMLVTGGNLYAVSDSGIAYCWRTSDGREMWKRRFGGKFSASPVLVDNLIYVTNEAGRTFVFTATAARCDLLSENQLGNETFATPAIVDSRMYLRYANEVRGRRQEYLACIGG